MEAGRKQSIGPRISRGQVTPPLGLFVGKDSNRGPDVGKADAKAGPFMDRYRPERRSLSKAFRQGTPVYVKGKGLRTMGDDVKRENDPDPRAKAADVTSHDVYDGVDHVEAPPRDVASTSQTPDEDTGVSTDVNPKAADVTEFTPQTDQSATNGHQHEGSTEKSDVTDGSADGDKLTDEEPAEMSEANLENSESRSAYSDSLDSLCATSPAEENGTEKSESTQLPEETGSATAEAAKEVPQGGSEAGEDHSDVISSQSASGSVDTNGPASVEKASAIPRMAKGSTRAGGSRFPLVRCSTLESERCSGKQRNLQATRHDSDPASGDLWHLTSGPVTKETITSRMRYEKCHVAHGPDSEALDYLTPTQRKEQALRELRRQVKELTSELEQREAEVCQLKASLGEESAKVYEMKEKELRVVRADLKVTLDIMDDVSQRYQDSAKRVEDLEEDVKQLKKEMGEREAHHQQMYLEMYRKGQNSAKFEKDDEIEVLIAKNAGGGATQELASMLTRTQSELAKWQSLRRQEAYSQAEPPETEAETTLAFLRDSFFHFMTDAKASDDHLRAMIRIFHFTSVEMKKIDKVLVEWKKKKKKM